LVGTSGIIGQVVVKIIRNMHRAVQRGIKQLVGNSGIITRMMAKINGDMVKQQVGSSGIVQRMPQAIPLEMMVLGVVIQRIMK